MTDHHDRKLVSPVQRYLTLLRMFVSTSLSAEMEYRANFTFSVLSSAMNLGASVFTVRLFFSHGASLGGWSWSSALVVLGAFTVLSGISQSLLQPNLNKLVEQVREGTLDFVLLKPVDPQLWLSTRRFSPWGIPDFVLGCALVVYGSLAVEPSVSAWLALVVSLACSCLILYSLWFIMATTTVWFVQIYNVTEVLRGLLDAGRFPIDAFPPGAYRFVFTFVIPVAFMTSVPAQVVLGQTVPAHLAGALVLGAALFAVSRAFFRFALRYYTSASS